MAEVATSVNTPASTNSDSGQIMASESSEPVLLSPGVKEAMDRIFPRSASQFLQPRALFDDNPMIDVPTGTFPNSHSRPSLPSTASMPHIVPNSSQTTALSISNDLLTCSASHMTSSSVITPPSPGKSLTSFSVTPIFENHEKDNEINSDLPGEGPNQPRKKLAKLRISKADLEIINSSDAFGDDSRGRSSSNKHTNAVTVSSSDCPSKGGSDSDEIIRPFANIGKEKKKKHKRKKKREKLDREKSNNVIYQKSGNSEDEFSIGSGKKKDRESGIQFSNTVAKSLDNGHEEIGTSTKRKKRKHSSLSVGNSDEDSLHLQDSMHKAKRSRTSSQDSHQSLTMPKDLRHKRVSDVDVSGNGNCSQKPVQENGCVSKDLFESDCEVLGEDISNISCSSSKENVHNVKRCLGQKLPKTKRAYFSLIKHKNKIKNTFPPCYVVLQKINMLPVYNVSKDKGLSDNVLPLSERVKCLSDLCVKGTLGCKVKKKKIVEKVRYKNIFDETVLPGQSEEDFESPREKRSLRKRDKNISYVEPSEDDIPAEFARKRANFIIIESPTRPDSEPVSDVQKKGKNDASDKGAKVVDVETVSSKDKVDDSKVVAPPKKKTKRTSQNENKSETQVSRKTDEGVEYEYVYPPSNSKTVYISGKDRNVIPSDDKKSKRNLSGAEKNKQKVSTMSQNSHISVLPTSSLPGSISTAPSVSVFPSLAPRLATQPIMTGPVLAPFQSSALPTTVLSQGALSSGAPKPQYCMVKMDGKDVLLQLVPSGISGSVSQTMLLPGGKKIIMPSSLPVVSSSQIIGHPVQRATMPNSTQIVTIPNSATASISQGSTIPTPPLQPLFGLPVVSRPVSVSSGSTALSALIKASQITNLPSTAGPRPHALSSQTSVAGSVMPPNVQTVTAPGSISSLRPTSSVIPALSAGVSAMAAPASTTVVRSVRVPSSVVRAVAPNQPNSVRSVRIFVPGCSATGMPGRFATLGSIAGASPLTRLSASSELLPQRKNASEQELSPEQKAAKRRKLEKKYPLPPGVIIKTEPLDSPPKSSSVQTTATRSLLPQNIQLLPSGARTGAGVQSIRIITPSVAGALSRSVRGSSNVIYRAASVGNNQTVLVPTSIGLLSGSKTTSSTTSNTTASITVLSTTCPSTVTSSINISGGATTTVLSPLTSTTCTPPVTTTISTSSFISVVATVSEPPPPNTTQSTDLNGNTESMTASSTTSSNSSVSTLSPAVTVAFTVSPTTTTESLTTASVSVTSASAGTITSSSTSSKSLTPSPREPMSDTAALENLRVSIEGLSKLVQGQENLGLKGERLDKLRELLRKKQEQYKELLSIKECSNTSNSVVSTLPLGLSENTSPQKTSDSGTNKSSSEAVTNEGSELDPFVID